MRPTPQRVAEVAPMGAGPSGTNIEKSNSGAAILSVAEVLDFYALVKKEEYCDSKEYWKRSCVLEGNRALLKKKTTAI